MEQILHQILSTSSTVILPHFGAIIKLGESYQFNEFLKYNDGKLIKAVEEGKGISTEEATEVVSDYIRKIKEHLNANKDFDIGAIGSFTKKADKVIIAKSEKINTNNTIKTKTKSVVNKEENTPKEKEDVKPLVIKKEETPTPPQKTTITTEKIKEELPKAYTSTNLVLDKAIEKVLSIESIEELKAFTKGETREKVLLAISNKKDSLEKPELKTPIVSKTVEKKIEKTKEAITPKPEKVKPSVVKEEKKETPPVITKKANTTPPSVKEDKKTEVTPPLQAPKTEAKKESIKTKTPSSKPETKKEDKKIEAELMAGAIVIEKEAKKRKRNRLILWVAILLLLIGTSIIGYLKKNEILALINKTEIAENKEVTSTKKEAEHSEKPHNNNKTSSETHNVDSHDEHSEIKPEGNDHEENDTSEELTNDDTENVEKIEEEQEVAIEEEETIEEIVEEEPETIEEVETVAKGKYNIVVGSFSEKGNATKLVEKLNNDGYKNARVLGKYGGLHAVSIDNFSSRNDAKSALTDIKGKGYSGWIKKI